jgi:hypothetical protein
MTQPESEAARPVTVINQGKGPGTLGSIMVAVIAIVGTVVGGVITGYYNYETTRHSTDTQRSSQLEDQRRATYSAFLSSATAVCIALQTGGVSPARGIALITDMVDKEASVLLISPGHMQAPVEQLVNYLQGQVNHNGTCDPNNFGTLRDTFLNAARQDFPDTY